MEHKKHDFEAVGNNYYAWILKAQELLASANILLRQCATRRFFPNELDKFEDESNSEGGKVFSVILMLWGMAAECLLKAFWLKLGGKLVAGGEYKKIPGTNDHQLDTLAKAVSGIGSFTFAAKEMDLLYRLSRYIVLGRYPIPRVVQVNKRKSPNSMDTGGWSFPCDDDLFANLCRRVFEELKK